jgi:hypothetical protein
MSRQKSGKMVGLGGIFIVSALAGCGGGGSGGGGGGGGNLDAPVEMLRHWTHVGIDASGLDHTPTSNARLALVDEGDNDRVFGHQLGPGLASRAIAMVQMAVFEAVNAIDGDYESEIGLDSALLPTSVEAAIAAAAHDTLVALFPSQQPIFDNYLAEDLSGLESGPEVVRGLDLGSEAAQGVLDLRSDDESNHQEMRVGIEYFPSDQPGAWSQDPISLHPMALGARWSDVDPFVLRSASQFRIAPPPALGSEAYAEAFEEVARLGGDGIVTPTERTEDQTEIGIYWAYDGTPSLCAPPRLYNQIAMQIAEDQGTDCVETARLLALVNIAMADGGIASWESKYYYEFWRPVTGIRRDDGNPDTETDETFSPLGAPASNLTGPNFTPPFPAYPSGHAVFGGVLFEMLRLFYGTDDIPFTFVSDEYNGSTIDNEGNIRPRRPRSFSNLSEAEEENGQSRIYLGIHWAFDKTEGIKQGRQISQYVFENLYRAVP